jgi:nucleoside-diphosphate-sugar epimerase
VDALMLAAESDAARDEDFIILDEGQVGLSGICAVIARELGLKYRAVHLPYRAMMAVAKATVKLTHMGVMPRPILSTTDVKSFGHDFRFSVAKASGVLGWKQKTSFETGIREALRPERQHAP